MGKQIDYKVTVGGRLVAGRVRLAGIVTGPAKFIMGRGYTCGVEIDVGGESYDIRVTSGRRPWDIAVGTPIVVIGQLWGHTLWVDKGGFSRCGPAVTPGLVRL